LKRPDSGETFAQTVDGDQRGHDTDDKKISQMKINSSLASDRALRAKWRREARYIFAGPPESL
jgi:hypothetical protein